MTEYKSVDEVIEESNKRMMAFEHEPSYWNGMMVYEAGDIEGYHSWLRAAIEAREKKVREEENRKYSNLVAMVKGLVRGLSADGSFPGTTRLLKNELQALTEDITPNTKD